MALQTRVFYLFDLRGGIFAIRDRFKIGEKDIISNVRRPELEDSDNGVLLNFGADLHPHQHLARRRKSQRELC